MTPLSGPLIVNGSLPSLLFLLVPFLGHWSVYGFFSFSARICQIGSGSGCLEPLPRASKQTAPLSLPAPPLFGPVWMFCFAFCLCPYAVPAPDSGMAFGMCGRDGAVTSHRSGQGGLPLLQPPDEFPVQKEQYEALNHLFMGGL